MTKLFQTKKTRYDLCKGNTLISRDVKAIYHGTESNPTDIKIVNF